MLSIHAYSLDPAKTTHDVLNAAIDIDLNALCNPAMLNQPIQRAVAAAGGQSSLARLIGARQQEVWNWLNGRPIPEHRCPAIERAVCSQVTCEELRPDVRWQRVPDPAWPHPGGRPCIDVAAPVEIPELQHG